MTHHRLIVIRRKKDGRFFSAPGAHTPWVPELAHARFFEPETQSLGLALRVLEERGVKAEVLDLDVVLPASE